MLRLDLASIGSKIIRPLRQKAVSCVMLPVGASERSLRCVGRKPLMSVQAAASTRLSLCFARSRNGRHFSCAQSDNAVVKRLGLLPGISR